MEKRTGIEELRHILGNLNYCHEDFLDRFTLEELVQLHRMMLASGWDIYPDAWTDRQVKQALAGKPPQWDTKTEKPLDGFEKQRAAYRAYKSKLEVEGQALAGDGFAPLLFEPSVEAIALKEQAGDYGRGWIAADCEMVDAADSMTGSRQPPADASPEFVAGWEDRIAEGT